jgi:adenine C2-methylase RlmN of 23S rRNA A2503 and tRNA A37
MPVPLETGAGANCPPVGLFDDVAATRRPLDVPAAEWTTGITKLRVSALRLALSCGSVPTLEALAKEAGLSAAWQHAAGNPTAPLVPCTSRLETALTSRDGSTTKLLIRLHDGLAVESVVLRHDSGAGRYGDGPRPGGKRATLCISSQVGCAMGCTFCATGTMGMVRNLSCGEIAEQALHALVHERSHLRNAVFMGMGEPLNNYAAVCAAIRTLTRPLSKGGFGLGSSRVTVSTVGVVPRMLTLATDLPGVRLALSLHAPEQETRRGIVPSASTWPLAQLMAAVDAYEHTSGHAPLIEYVLLAGVNDSPDHARLLGELLERRRSTVNLIPFNSTGSADVYAAPSADVIDAFQRTLRTQFGINVTVRRSMGRDVQGACGQLATSTQATRDIEDLSPTAH